MYKILFTTKAEKAYKHLCKTNKAIFKRVRAALQYIAQNPAEGKPLKLNLKGLWAYRVGSYRIIYSISHHILTVRILEIDHRRDVYR